jgi:ferritin-like metal-binding protein YciE
MATTEERLMEWLRDAHAMEKQAETMLSGMAGRIENYPQVRAKIEQHLEETRDQARRLEACIERRGGDTSTAKDLVGRFAAMGQGLGGMFAGDEIVKGAMAGYTFEHMEIASYQVLIATAEAAGDEETARTCRAILGQEVAMARWLEEHLPTVTREYLGREEAPGATAKR